MKHVILVIVVGIIAATGVTAMFQRLSEANADASDRDVAVSEWRDAIRDYDNSVDQYQACLSAVQARIETREDNQRENESDMRFIDIMDRWLDDDADDAIAEARAAEVEDAKLDEEARPLLDPADCEDPGEPPVFPDLD
jgi:predicted  nucleic acid-binding Zn-ribbon protein